MSSHAYLDLGECSRPPICRTVSLTVHCLGGDASTFRFLWHCVVRRPCEVACPHPGGAHWPLSDCLFRGLAMLATHLRPWLWQSESCCSAMGKFPILSMSGQCHSQWNTCATIGESTLAKKLDSTSSFLDLIFWTPWKGPNSMPKFGVVVIFVSYNFYPSNISTMRKCWFEPLPPILGPKWAIKSTPIRPIPSHCATWLIGFPFIWVITIPKLVKVPTVSTVLNLSQPGYFHNGSSENVHNSVIYYIYIFQHIITISTNKMKN